MMNNRKLSNTAWCWIKKEENRKTGNYMPLTLPTQLRNKESGQTQETRKQKMTQTNL